MKSDDSAAAERARPAGPRESGAAGASGDFPDRPRPAGARFLFVAGCQRSGTTEFVWIVNGHPRVGVGMERFKRLARPKRVDRYRPELFDHMFDFADGNTNVTPDAAEWQRFYRKLARKWPRLAVIGDKVPSFFEVYGQMAGNFPEARFVQLVRNPLPVAASWLERARKGRESWPAENDHVAGIRAWNEANAAALAMAEAHPDRFLVLGYEWFFSGDRSALERVARFLDLGVPDAWAATFAQRTRHWAARRDRRLKLSVEEADQVVREIDWRSWEAVRRLIRSG